MKTLAFRSDLTWRKLGYYFFSDSGSYREVIKQNPQWSIDSLPPVGAEITVNDKPQPERNLIRLLNPQTNNEETAIYPFGDPNHYFNSLNRYSLSAIRDRDIVNGITSDGVG